MGSSLLIFRKSPVGVSRPLIVILIMTLNLFPAEASQKIGALPLHVFENSSNNKPFILYITGDGGWNAFSQNLTQHLYNQHYNIVALDARKYFWDAKTPEDFTSTVRDLVTFYQNKWRQKEFAILGYSFGADVSAFLVAGLDNSIIKSLQPVVLLSPSTSTDFEIHLSELIGTADHTNRKYKVSSALIKCKVPVLCIFGEDEDSALIKNFPENNLVKKKILKGSHHFNNDISALGKIIIQVISKTDLKN